MASDLLDQLAQSYVNAIVTGQREPNYLQVPYYLRPPAEALNQNAMTNGAISNASWLDFNPIAKSAIDTFMEASGAAPSARLVDRLVKAPSPVLRPQPGETRRLDLQMLSPFGLPPSVGGIGVNVPAWADDVAGVANDLVQTGLAGADLAALAPIVGRRAANSLMNELGQVDVWHGSPHRFDRVSHEKIGTGEGAQAFGWGTYYSDKKDIAKHYAESLSTNVRKLDLIASPYKGETKEYTIKKLRQAAKDAKFNGRNWDAREYEETIQWIEAGKPDQYSSGATYRAQLFPDKDPSEYMFLDWHRPLKEQGPKVKEIVDRAAAKYRELTERANSLQDIPENDALYKQIIDERNEKYAPFVDVAKKFDKYDGNQLYWALTQGDMSSTSGVAKKASLLLKELGIDGIRYPTGILSGKGPKGGGAYNYVVFDENDVRLVQRESGGVVEDLLKNQQ